MPSLKPKSVRYATLKKRVKLQYKHTAKYKTTFKDIKKVRDNAHKVTFYEKESDVQFTSLAHKIFGSTLPLDQKIHLQYFVERIDRICDQAEDIADEIQIYAIKRTI